MIKTGVISVLYVGVMEKAIFFLKRSCPLTTLKWTMQHRLQLATLSCRSLKEILCHKSDFNLEDRFVLVSSGERRIIFSAVYIPPASLALVYTFSFSVSRFNLCGAVCLHVECVNSGISARLLCACCSYLAIGQANPLPNAFRDFLDLFSNLADVRVH